MDASHDATTRAARLATQIKARRLGLTEERDLAERAGIDHRVWRRAFFGRVICAQAHMAICHELGLDPASVESAPPSEPYRGAVQWDVLGLAVHVERLSRGHGVREAAQTTGVSTATISRCEGGQVLSFDALARLAGYVRQHPHGFTHGCEASACSTGNTHCNSLKNRETGDA